MHAQREWTFVNGQTWVLGTGDGFLEDLEDLFQGSPAFAILADSEDLRYTRWARIVWALTSGYRERTSLFSAMTYREFRAGGFLPHYESAEWDRMVAELSDWISQCFPEAVRRGRALLAAAREALRLGLVESFAPSSENGGDPSGAPTVTPNFRESTGS